MSIFDNLFQFVKTSSNLKNFVRNENNFKKNFHVNFFFEKRFCENVVDVHLITFQIFKNHDNEKQT